MAKVNSWETARAVIDASMGNVLLHGIPGTGKSFAAQFGAPGCRNLTLTEETPMAELRGHFVPRGGGEFVWHDGPVIAAMRAGERIVVNEIDRGGGDVLGFMLAVCDDPESCRITLPTGETVRPAPGFHVVATMNGAPSDLSPALADRFHVRVEITEPHPAAFDTLPERYRNAARSTAVAAGDSRIPLRAWLAFARLVRVVDERTAAQAVFGTAWESVIDSLDVAAS